MSGVNIEMDTERDEQITAYVDGQMTALQQAGFEGRIGQDSALRHQVAATQYVSQLARQMPVLTVPRHFGLPAHYATPVVRRGLSAWLDWQWISRAASLVCGAMCLLLLMVDAGQRMGYGSSVTASTPKIESAPAAPIPSPILNAFAQSEPANITQIGTLPASSGATLIANGMPVAPLSVMTDLPSMSRSTEALPAIQATAPAIAQTPMPRLPQVLTITSTPITANIETLPPTLNPSPLPRMLALATLVLAILFGVVGWRPRSS